MILRQLFTSLAISNYLVLDCKKLRYQTFDLLRNSEFFVDKTFLLMRFLAGPNHMLVTAPPGFGKTTNLDMIRRFAEMDVFDNGTMKTDKSSHKNYETFANVVPSTGKYLKAFTTKRSFKKHFGEYPVIWLDLDSGVKTYNKLDFMRLILNGTIRAAFTDHAYLLNSPVISPADKKLFRKFFYHNCSSEASVRAYSPRLGIGLLKKLLKRHFLRDPIVLMDNCDAPLREVILDPRQRNEEAIGKLLEVTNILEAIPGYDSGAEAEPAYRSFITGAIAPFHRSNNYRHKHGLFKNQISKSYGFTKTEVEELLTKKNLKPTVDNVEEWYGGFYEHEGIQLYNPQAVISFLTSKTNEIKAYWAELGSLATFEPALRPECFGRQVMECLNVCEFPMVDGWPPYGQFSLKMSVEDTKKLQELQKLPLLPFQCTKRTRYFFITYLENLGYLNYRNYIDRKKLAKPLWDCERRYRFKIPNLEVSNYVQQMLYSAIVTKTPLNGEANFREELIGAISGVDGSETGMRRLAVALTTLLVATERRPSEIRVDSAVLAHYVRVHLLHPPSQFKVKYVKISPNEEERVQWKTNLDGDLVYAIETKRGLLACAVKIELMGEKLEAINHTSLDAYLETLALKEPEKVIKNSTAKVAANLNCDQIGCQFSYLYNSTNLRKENSMHIEKESILKRAKAKWINF